MDEQNEKKSKLKYVIIAICVIVILGIIVYFVYNQFMLHSNKEIYSDIEVNEELNDSEVAENVEKVRNLQKENADVKGWIKIDDTIIDYPILQTTDNEYYLKHNYKKEESKYGSIYLKNECDIKNNNSNLIIYGHNMKDDQMFNCLLKYENKDFFDNHQKIKIATDNEENEYSIISVFKSRVFYQDEDDVFRYYNYINFEDENQYNEYVDNCKKIQLYDTGLSAKYGEQLVTLITCEYSQENGRMVVVAKKSS